MNTYESCDPNGYHRLTASKRPNYVRAESGVFARFAALTGSISRIENAYQSDFVHSPRFKDFGSSSRTLPPRRCENILYGNFPRWGKGGDRRSNFYSANRKIIMPTYRPVSCRFWNDSDIEDLSPEAKLVFLFLFTNDSTTESGIYGISAKRISERTGIPEKRCAEILDKDLKSKITYDHKKKIIFIHSFLHCNNRGAPALILNSLLKNARDFQSALCWLSFVRIYKDKHYINKIIYLIKTFPSVSKDFAKSSLKIEDLSFNDFLKSFEVKDARVESEQGKAGDADEPITPEANAQLEESPAHGSNEPGAGRIVDEPQPASVKKKKEFIPPTLEDVRAFFKEKGYKDSEALRMWNGYDVADWHDSQGKQIKNWKQKAYQVWFKDENKISASAQFVPSRQDQALERPAPPPWKSYDQQRREADEEAHKLEQQARQNRKEAPVIIPGFKMPELKGMP